MYEEDFNPGCGWFSLCKVIQLILHKESTWRQGNQEGRTWTRHRFFTILLRSGNQSDLEILVFSRFILYCKVLTHWWWFGFVSNLLCMTNNHDRLTFTHLFKKLPETTSSCFLFSYMRHKTSRYTYYYKFKMNSFSFLCP